MARVASYRASRRNKSYRDRSEFKRERFQGKSIVQLVVSIQRHGPAPCLIYIVSFNRTESHGTEDGRKHEWSFVRRTKSLNRKKRQGRGQIGRVVAARLIIASLRFRCNGGCDAAGWTEGHGSKYRQRAGRRWKEGWKRDGSNVTRYAGRWKTNLVRRSRICDATSARKLNSATNRSCT